MSVRYFSSSDNGDVTVGLLELTFCAYRCEIALVYMFIHNSLWWVVSLFSCEIIPTTSFGRRLCSESDDFPF